MKPQIENEQSPTKLPYYLITLLFIIEVSGDSSIIMEAPLLSRRS